MTSRPQTARIVSKILKGVMGFSDDSAIPVVFHLRLQLLLMWMGGGGRRNEPFPTERAANGLAGLHRPAESVNSDRVHYHKQSRSQNRARERAQVSRCEKIAYGGHGSLQQCSYRRTAPIATGLPGRRVGGFVLQGSCRRSILIVVLQVIPTSLTLKKRRARRS